MAVFLDAACHCDDGGSGSGGGRGSVGVMEEVPGLCGRRSVIKDGFGIRARARVLCVCVSVQSTVLQYYRTSTYKEGIDFSRASQAEPSRVELVGPSSAASLANMARRSAASFGGSKVLAAPTGRDASICDVQYSYMVCILGSGLLRIQYEYSIHSWICVRIVDDTTVALQLHYPLQ